MIGGHTVFEIPEQLGELLGEVVGGRLATVALQREGGQLVGPGGAPEPEVDPSREQPGQQAEGLRHLEGAVVPEHHPATADTDAAGGGGDRADERLGAGPASIGPPWCSATQ